MNLKLKSQIILKYGSQSNFAQALRADETIISRVIHGRRELDKELEGLPPERQRKKGGGRPLSEKKIQP